MLTFGHLWVFLCAPLPWLVRSFFPPRQTSRLAVRVPFGDRLRAAEESTGSMARARKGISRQLLPAFTWLLLLTSLARPEWLEAAITKELPTRDLLLLVDLSGSMQAEDFTNASGEAVDRLTAVKEVLGEFLLRREGDRVGLVVFGDAPFLQAPFSTDLNLSRQLLEETVIGMAGPRTAFGDAIGLGVNLFADSTAPAKTIITLTDGNDTMSQVPPVEAARIASERDIRIHTVAIGDPATVGEEKLDEAALREVAETAGGSFFFAADREQLAGIYEELDKIETRQIEVVSHRPRRALFYWPLLAALLLSVLEKASAAVRQSRTSGAAGSATRIRVDPITGRLEVQA